MEYNKLKEKYDKILELSSEEGLKIDLEILKRGINAHLQNVELLENYGIDTEKMDKSCMRYFVWEEHSRISVNSGNKKPIVGDRLFVIHYSTGAYIFGDYYPKEMFIDFWNELKSYNPDFYDDINNYLYFKIENAKNIFKDYPLIWEKYKELNKENYKKHQKEKLQRQINELERK